MLSWLLRWFNQEVQRQTYLPTEEPAVIESASICCHPYCNCLSRALCITSSIHQLPIPHLWHDHLFVAGEQMTKQYLGSWVLKRDILCNEILPLNNECTTAECSRTDDPGWLYKREQQSSSLRDLYIWIIQNIYYISNCALEQTHGCGYSLAYPNIQLCT
jgi:hypothetical protein